MGTRFLLSEESGAPQSVKEAYFESAVTDTVRTRAIDGVPQRVINTTMVRGLESAKLLRFPRAMVNALKFRRLTQTTFPDLISEAISMKKNQDLTWSQLMLAANAPMLTKATMVEGNHEIGIMPTGVGLGVINSAPPVEMIIRGIIAEASDILSELNQQTLS